MIITVFRSNYSNWSYKPISRYKKRTELEVVTVLPETSNMAERFTIESLPVHLITHYVIQGLVEPVRAWMKKTGLTDEQIKRFAERYPSKRCQSVMLQRHCAEDDEETKRGHSCKSLNENGLTTKRS